MALVGATEKSVDFCRCTRLLHARIFDLFVLSLDYSYLMMAADVVLLRFVRILRVVRLIRIVKLSKLNTMIEESAASAGRQWVTLVVAITKTAVMMPRAGSAGHICCFWFYIYLL